VSLSVTPDDKRDLIMPSLDRRTKRRSLSFYCSCCAKSEKKKKKKKKKRKEEYGIFLELEKKIKETM
jgi:hypothetical protein